jgi:hypothetical protein
MHSDTFNRLVNTHVLKVPRESVIVEIGSYRFEDSTVVLDRLAQQYCTKLLSVDIATTPRERIGNCLTNTEFIIEKGSTWAKNYSGLSISVLYLDNFDYEYNLNNILNSHYEQAEFYQSMGLEMTNNNCQIEHMSQLLFLYPYLTSDATVIFDDTYQINECWVGKCGPGVIYLQAQGWKILEHTTDAGVILRR